MRIAVLVTGASGVIYAKRFLEILKEKDIPTDLVISENAAQIIEDELRISPKLLASLASRQYMPDDLFSPLASGTYRVDAVVVVPCSMKTLAAAANGYGNNLIARCIDVALKEKHKLILVPRETPMSAIHLENMLSLARLGVVIIPASPGFYHNPKGIEDLVEFVVAKMLSSLGIEHSIRERTKWTGGHKEKQ